MTEYSTMQETRWSHQHELQHRRRRRRRRLTSSSILFVAVASCLQCRAARVLAAPPTILGFSLVAPTSRRFYPESSTLSDRRQDINEVYMPVHQQQHQQHQDSPVEKRILISPMDGTGGVVHINTVNGDSDPHSNGVALKHHGLFAKKNGVHQPSNGVTQPSTMELPSLNDRDQKQKKPSSSPPSNEIATTQIAPEVNTPSTIAATTTATIRNMWRRRNARSAEEGIRREKATQLSTILTKATSQLASVQSDSRAANPRYAARTITGLINALAEEAENLEVEVVARRDTPLWSKHVDAVTIQFSRLGFKPLRMGGLNRDDRRWFPDTSIGAFTVGRQLTDLSCADEAFDRIDVDNSGALDTDEIAEALTLAAVSGTPDQDLSKRYNLEFLRNLASELVSLYDFNGDGVVDRTEYQSMVEDMAALREAQEHERQLEMQKQDQQQPFYSAWVTSMSSFVTGLFKKQDVMVSQAVNETLSLDANDYKDVEVVKATNKATEPGHSNGDSKPLGSITLSDLKLDLRRLLFGAIPILKHVTPGGPLVLEPFTATIKGSFNQDDIKNSFLLDAGLRRLVAQALKRRVRSLRDFMDGAVFHGRSWKMSSKTAPSVEVLELTNVEFDSSNKLILTGRVRVQPRQEVPVIENSFKLRTKIGTRRDGRFIRLVEPELALVLECPKTIEKNIAILCDLFSLDRPCRPEPLYSFFPIYSPFKLDDNDGFDLGEDNCIKSIDIQDKALRFELSAVLRPGRFLGNHYLAFTVPKRTFIITLDRVKEGIRAARKTKRAARALREAVKRKQRWRYKRRSRPSQPADDDLLSYEGSSVRGGRSGAYGRAGGSRSVQQQLPLQPPRPPKSFFSRFVDGYLQAERDDIVSERVTTAIRDFFGRQGQPTSSSSFSSSSPSSPLPPLSSPFAIFNNSTASDGSG